MDASIIVPAAVAIVMGLLQWSLSRNVAAIDASLKVQDADARKLREELATVRLDMRDLVRREQFTDLNAAIAEVNRLLTELSTTLKMHIANEERAANK